jgi:hypothetical protein
MSSSVQSPLSSSSASAKCLSNLSAVLGGGLTAQTPPLSKSSSTANLSPLPHWAHAVYNCPPPNCQPCGITWCANTNYPLGGAIVYDGECWGCTNASFNAALATEYCISSLDPAQALAQNGQPMWMTVGAGYCVSSCTSFFSCTSHSSPTTASGGIQGSSFRASSCSAGWLSPNGYCCPHGYVPVGHWCWEKAIWCELYQGQYPALFGFHCQPSHASKICSSSWNFPSPESLSCPSTFARPSYGRLETAALCSDFAVAKGKITHQAWILDFNPKFINVGSSMNSVSRNTNLFLGDAKYNLETLCKLLATNSSRGSDCIPCPSLSSGRSVSSASSSSSLSQSSKSSSSSSLSDKKSSSSSLSDKKSSSSSLSDKKSSSSSSSASAIPFTHYNHYDMYKCGTWTSNICRQFYTYMGGTQIRVPNNADKANLYSCPQNVGPSLGYKLTKVIENASTSTCALLITRPSFTAARYVVGTLGNYGDCASCLPSPSPTAQSSCPCDNGAWRTKGGGFVDRYDCEVYYLAKGYTQCSPSTISGGGKLASISSSSSSSTSSLSAAPTSSHSYVTKCYTAKTSHQANTVNEPGVGTSWTNYWAECNCCPLPSVNPLTALCPIFHVDEEESRGPWTGREPEYNRNLTITQGDTVCYRFSVFDHGQPVNLEGHDVAAHIMSISLASARWVLIL